MYPWIWRHLPGPFPIRLVCALILLVLAVMFLFEVVFPWLDPQLPWNDVSVE